MNEVILVIDDDAEFVQYLKLRLEGFGYRVVTAQDGAMGLELAADAHPDLITLDIMMPGMDGWEICRRLHAVSNAPILMITARGRVGDVVRGLEIGADDYLVKPFNTSELLARVKAILRRAKAPGAPQRTSNYKVRDLELDTDRRIVKIRGERVDLTPTEFKLLTCFISNAGRVLPHRYCLVEVWGPEYGDQVDYLKLYVRYLRQKLEKEPSNPEYILTEWGVGYRMVDE